MTADLSASDATAEPADTDQPLDDWWTELSKVALFGTARREPPATPRSLPSRSDRNPETAVLDAIALGSALLRAGSQPAMPTDAHFIPAGPDQRAEPTARARQLLELIMTQSPAGKRLQTQLLRCWLWSAADTGRRIPHRWLPDVLDRVRRDASLTGDPQTVAMIRVVADERGRWLSELDPAWSWLLHEFDAPTSPQEWARQPTPQRAATVRRLRTEDAGAARELIMSTLSTDGAQDRAKLLGCLEVGLSSADESLLERGLDDRSAVVRTVAAELLNGLDDSARAGRMADRLRRQLSIHGLINKKLTIDLPLDPDAAGIRDGLGEPPNRRSERGYWLERLAAGSALSVWTDVTGKGPAQTWRMITDHDAQSGIIAAVLARHDQQWAVALSADQDRMRSRPASYLQLLHLLPPDTWERLATEWLSELTNGAMVAAVIRGAPTPWGPRFSSATLNALDRVNLPIGDLIDQLARGLHPTALERLGELATGQGSVAAREGARNLVQYLTLRTEITEAFR